MAKKVSRKQGGVATTEIKAASKTERYPPIAARKRRIKKWREDLCSSDDRIKSRGMAFGIWEAFGVMLHSEVDHLLAEYSKDKIAMTEINEIEQSLMMLHRTACEVLMSDAESLQIDSTEIETAGRYCRELLKRKSRDRYFDAEEYVPFWPDCLGDELLQLEPSIRAAIINGNAKVLQLNIKSGMKIKKRRRTPPKCDDRNSEFWRLKQEGKTGKQIAAWWNLENPEDNVSEVVVRMGIKRHRDTL